MLEFNYKWNFKKVWYVTPKLGGLVGHQWGDKSQGGFDYTYWNVGLALDFNERPQLELDIRYLDARDFSGFTCPPSGANARSERFMGSLTATF